MPLLIALSGCESSSGPTGPGGPIANPQDTGIITDLPPASSLIGAWGREDEVEYDGADALRTTEWRFDGRGTCRLTITTWIPWSVAPVVEESVCAYRADGRQITFRFGRFEDTLGWELDGRDVLILDGQRYFRLHT